jgi:hypothetical protein
LFILYIDGGNEWGHSPLDRTSPLQGFKISPKKFKYDKKKKMFGDKDVEEIEGRRGEGWEWEREGEGKEEGCG